jgi:hypothetical protein
MIEGGNKNEIVNSGCNKCVIGFLKMRHGVVSV